MAKYVLLGLENEDRMLVVDCEAMTVGEIDREDIGADELQAASGARAAGLPLFKGVDVAIATAQRSETASFPYVQSFPYTESA